MGLDDVIQKLRSLNIKYIQNNIGTNPGLLPHYFQEYMGYATLLYNHFSEIVASFTEKSAEILKEEQDIRAEFNKEVDAREGKVSEKMGVGEVEQRVSIRVAKLEAQKKKVEQVVKGATLHVNACQSLMKNYNDEAKGIR